MSAVRNAQTLARHGLKTGRHAAQAARIIRNDAPRKVRDTIPPTSRHGNINGQRMLKFDAKDHPTTAGDTSTLESKFRNDVFPQRTKPSSNPNSTKTPKPPPLLSFIHEPRPQPLNCTTLQATRLFATDPSHPLHIRTQRRLAAFDPAKLTWRVQVPVAVSKKPAIRREAERRVKNVVREELEGKEGIKGALLMIMNKDPMRSLRFGREEVQKEVRGWIARCLGKRDGGSGNGRGGSAGRAVNERNNGSRRGDFNKDGFGRDPKPWRQKQTQGNGSMSFKDDMLKDASSLGRE